MSASINTLNFLDANVWLALLWNRHVHFQIAQDWFDRAGEEQFFWCRFTQISVLRLLTTESILGTDTRTMTQAWGIWDRVLEDPRISLLPEPDTLEQEFRSRSRLTSRSPKLWADAYLLGFSSAAGLKLVTFDQAMKARGADVLVLN